MKSQKEHMWKAYHQLRILLNSRGPQQAEILDTDAEIRDEILLEIRDPK